MKNASAQGNTGVSQGNPLPLCHWSFNRAHEFHHVSGDAVSLFGRPAADLRRRHVSMIDDPSGSWSARLDRMFQRQSPIEQSAAPGPEGEYALLHVPVHADHGAAIYVAGFAFPAGSPLPCATQIEWAANAILQALDLERTRATRFLHDVVAQSLSGTGFQLKLLKPEIHAQSAEALKRTLEIQKSLDEVLKLIREFNAPE
jgi:hypothetical protein